ncbi:MAG: hypothetical protein N2255_08495, partial [Kiritimatiellae bacterium]|nr:hypothetical protein [Kiritimatiellia bacterium]
MSTSKGALPNGCAWFLASLAIAWSALNEHVRADGKTPVPTGPEFKPVREIRVPFRDLNALLQGGAKRVLLPREEYEALLKKAGEVEKARAPVTALLTAAEYDIRVDDERALIKGSIQIDVLEEGLGSLGLDFAGVGLQAARLGNRAAPLGLAADGRIVLFVEGKGSHVLTVEGVTPLQRSAAQQVMALRLPTPAATRLTVHAKGDVEVRSGAAVIKRTYEPGTDETTMELLPRPGDLTLVLSLNSRFERRDRLVMARSVIINEVGDAVERLYSTVSLEILHRPLRSFQFAVPDHFEVTSVETPNLAQWLVEKINGRNVLQVLLREEATDTVVISLTALRPKPNLNNWSFSRFEPLDVVGHVALLGLLLESRLTAYDLTPHGLIPTDVEALTRIMPTLHADTGRGRSETRAFVSYYAPQPAFGLTARFLRPPAKLHATSNLLLSVELKGLQVRGGFSLAPLEDELFEAVFTVPPGWEVKSVTDGSGTPLLFDVYTLGRVGKRIRVLFSQAVPPGGAMTMCFTAEHMPPGWLDDWKRTTIEFPFFELIGATRRAGALAVEAEEALQVVPNEVKNLWPLDQSEKDIFGLGRVASGLLYRYEGDAYSASFTVVRIQPRITAETYSFFTIQPSLLSARYEIVYVVNEASADKVSFFLPPGTPKTLTVKGFADTEVREYTAIAVSYTHLRA